MIKYLFKLSGIQRSFLQCVNRDECWAQSMPAFNLPLFSRNLTPWANPHFCSVFITFVIGYIRWQSPLTLLTWFSACTCVFRPKSVDRYESYVDMCRYSVLCTCYSHISSRIVSERRALPQLLNSKWYRYFALYTRNLDEYPHANKLLFCKFFFSSYVTVKNSDNHRFWMCTCS